MFALAACQEKPIEQPVVETPEVEVEYQDVTFSVAAPSGPQTRTSYGETVTFPTELHVAVYVAEGNETEGKVGTWLKDVKSVIVPKAEGEDVINTEWEVTISLVKNYSYDIVFWAQKEDSDYYAINWEARTITANYEVAANDVTRDAFYHVAKGYNYITATEDDARIQLTRPFAQINLGASDYAALIEHSGFVNGTANPDLHTTITSVTATIPNVLNVLTSEATGTADVKFSVAPTTELVKDENDIKVTGTNAAGVQETMKYKLVGSNYIFANPYKENNPTVELDLTFEYNGKSFDLNVPNVPYARNYQTNILGNFFTSNSKFNVVIVPQFKTPDQYVDENGNKIEPTKNEFAVEFPAATIPAEGGNATFKVTGNVSWTVEVAGATASQTSGKGEAEVTLTFPKNEAAEVAEYKVSVVTEAEVAQKKFEATYTQAAAEIVTPEEPEQPVVPEPVSYSIQFGKSYNSKNISSYTDTWSVTYDGFTCNMANWNNNNNQWNYVKAGRKDNASIATITTATSIPEVITNVTLTIDSITADKIKALTLYVASNDQFADAQVYSVTPSTGDLTFNVTSPAANSYYKIEVNCDSGSKNGLIQVSKVVFAN